MAFSSQAGFGCWNVPVVTWPPPCCKWSAAPRARCWVPASGDGHGEDIHGKTIGGFHKLMVNNYHVSSSSLITTIYLWTPFIMMNG